MKYVKSGALKVFGNNDKALISHDDLVDLKNRRDEATKDVAEILEKPCLNPLTPLTEEERDELKRS